MQHDGSVRNGPRPTCALDQFEEDWRRDVVGEITGDSKGTVACELRQIDGKHVGDDEARVRRQGRLKARGEIAVDFNSRELPHARRQSGRQNAGARSDFEETIVRPWRYRLHDLVCP